MTHSPDASEAVLVDRQIGRRPRDPWRVAVRCRFGRPQVIASPPMLSDGSRFPTLYWLTCPYLLRAVEREESEGGVALAAAGLARDKELAEAMTAADAEYRRRRTEEGGGIDACAEVGVAGQREPLATKCLHAHVAAALARIADPVGLRLLRETGTACPEDRCARLVLDRSGVVGDGETR